MRLPGLRVPGADAKVAVEGAGSLVADLDDPRLAVLAPNSDLPLPQVQIATLRVVGVEADAREFGQPDAGRFSGGCAGPGKSTSAACAASMPLRSVRESRIVAVFPEPFVSTLLARSHNLGRAQPTAGAPERLLPILCYLCGLVT